MFFIFGLCNCVEAYASYVPHVCIYIPFFPPPPSPFPLPSPSLPPPPGVIVGLILKYSIVGNVPKEFLLAVEGNSSSNCSEMEMSFEVGQTIQVNTLEDSFTCSIQGKIFKDASGNFVRSTVSSFKSLIWVILFPVKFHNRRNMVILCFDLLLGYECPTIDQCAELWMVVNVYIITFFLFFQLLFDPEIFFFALLPPIIFYAGYSLNKVH